MVGNILVAVMLVLQGAAVTAYCAQGRWNDAIYWFGAFTINAAVYWRATS